MARILISCTVVVVLALFGFGVVPVMAVIPTPVCHLRGALPDPACTPGAVLTTDPNVVCKTGYAGSVRNVTDATKNAVYAEYGITGDHTGYVIDHLIALEDGGDTTIANLWPQRVDGWPGAGEKDTIEGSLHRAVCGGRVSLPDAQRWLATDWRTAFIEPSGT
ncbi:MAG: HNH endonuclease [Gemmatimonadaceae bacterium]